MAREKKESSDVEMTFFEHLEDLRPHLMRAIGALFVIAILAFIFSRFIIDGLLFGPQSPDFPTNRWLCNMGYTMNDFVGWLGRLFDAEWSMDPTVMCLNQTEYNMVNFKVAGQFNLHLKMSMVTGFVLGIPYLLHARILRYMQNRRYLRRGKVYRYCYDRHLCYRCEADDFAPHEAG